jgi:triphosphatase
MTHRAQSPGKVELEFELDGDAANLVRLSPVEDRHIQAGVINNEERGLMLAESAFGHERKACPVEIGREMDVGQVFVRIVHECLRHFQLNEPLIVEQRDPGALHQARVAVRRLRSAFTFFAPAIRKGSLRPLRKELRAFVGPFGDARNLDVFLAAHRRELNTSDCRKVMAARARAYDRVIEKLKAQSSRELHLRLVEWTASGDWQKRAASTPIERFAAGRVNAAWRKVKRHRSSLRNLDEQHLHRLRINVKKLRYTVDFLAPLYAKKQVRKFAAALEEVQECLGLIHDEAIGRQVASAFGLSGVDLIDEKGRSHRLRAISRRFKHLKRVERFWTS